VPPVPPVLRALLVLRVPREPMVLQAVTVRTALMAPRVQMV